MSRLRGWKMVHKKSFIAKTTQNEPRFPNLPANSSYDHPIASYDSSKLQSRVYVGEFYVENTDFP